MTDGPVRFDPAESAKLTPEIVAHAKPDELVRLIAIFGEPLVREMAQAYLDGKASPTRGTLTVTSIDRGTGALTMRTRF